MNLDHNTIRHIFTFVHGPSATRSECARSTAVFAVSRHWHVALCAPAAVPFWQSLFHARFPRFLQPASPSKKRNVTAVSHNYRKLFLYTSAILQIDSSMFTSRANELEDHLDKDAPKYRHHLMEALAFRCFTRNFPQFKTMVNHHLLYGPAGCGKSTQVASLARTWGAHVITVQYPELVRASERIEWNGYVDILCYYVLSFCEANTPTIIHLHNMCHIGTNLTQGALVSLFQKASSSSAWIIGTTTMPNSLSVRHAGMLQAKLFVPFPATHEREAFLKSRLLPSLPSSISDAAHQLSSPVPVALASIQLLAQRTQDFTYTDLKVVCNMVLEEFNATSRQESLPFVKLMDAFARVAPSYKSEEAKKFDNFDKFEVVTERKPTQVKRRLSVPLL